MIYVGVDIAKADHCVAAIDGNGRVVLKPTTITQDAAGFHRLGQLLRQLGTPETVMVGAEATGHYWVLLAEEIQSLGWTPTIFNPLLSCEAGRTSVRGRKTDEDDALVIAKVLRDGGFHPMRLPDAAMGNLKRLCRYRQGAVERSANLKKRLIGHLDLVFPEFAALFSDAYGVTARAILAKAPSARLLAESSTRSLSATMGAVSRGRIGVDRAKAVIAAARSSIARSRIDHATELAIRMTIQEIDLLEQQIAVYDSEIAQADPPGKSLLLTVPGIGPVLAAVILAEIGDIERFRGGNGVHRLLAFAGLDPRIRESGQWSGKPRMSKRGSSALRTACWRAAFVASRHEAFKPIYDQHRLVMKQHAKLAISHVARKMVQAIYGVLRHQKPFNIAAFQGKVRDAA